MSIVPYGSRKRQECFDQASARSDQKQDQRWRVTKNLLRMFSLRTHWPHSSRLQSKDPLYRKTPETCTQKKRGCMLRRRAGNIEKTCRWEPLIWSFKVLLDRGDTEGDGEEFSLNVGMNHLTFCRKRIPGHGTHRSPYPAPKSCTSVKLSASSVCLKLGMYCQQLPSTAHQYDISSEGESHLTKFQRKSHRMATLTM